MNLYGMRVIESPLCTVPRMQLSQEICKFLTDEFISSTNHWMREFFGLQDVAYKFTDPTTGQETIAMTPAMVAKLKFEKEGYFQ